MFEVRTGLLQMDAIHLSEFTPVATVGIAYTAVSSPTIANTVTTANSRCNPSVTAHVNISAMSRFKLVFFSPIESTNAILNHLFSKYPKNLGRIGQYEHCAFLTRGTGASKKLGPK